MGLVGKNPDGSNDSFEAAKLLKQLARDSGSASRLVSLVSLVSLGRAERD